MFLLKTSKLDATQQKIQEAFCRNFGMEQLSTRYSVVPDLFSYIQTIVDDKKINGIYILTGSQQFDTMQKITQSLAGRTAILKLLPFQYSEVYEKYKFNTLNELLYTGLYPRIYDQNINATEAMRFYINTYVERDVRQLINVKDITLFEVFLKLLAGRSGQILNTNSLGNECGVSHNTIRSWISVLALHDLPTS